VYNVKAKSSRETPFSFKNPNFVFQGFRPPLGEYFCPVCRLLVYPKEALQSQCSHLYCKPCLTYVVRTTQACPYDGYLVTEADAKPLLESNKVLADTIGKISVNCLFHRSGCTWQGQLEDCKSHCSGCPFGDSSVMCNRCGVQIVHRQVEEHAQNCPGVQTQAPQSDNGQVASSTALNAPSTQNQTVVPTSAPASQGQIASVASAAVQKSAQQVNTATQSQAAQAAMPNTELWYQQQQQYQQYYQQYPGYDPYQQQQYQQYYPYQQQSVQAVQQFQQPAQIYPSQLPGQQQAPPSHTGQQPQQLAQAPPTAQPQSHLPQATPKIQQQIQPQALQNQVAYSAAQSQPQPQPYSQVQPYAHPQTGTQAVPQQGMQMPPYQQTRPQMQQPPPPQMQTQPYTQPQAQQYSHPQTHLPAQTQTHPHPNSHAATLQPPRPTQPMNHAGPLQPQNAPVHAVSGYQSYQQVQAPPLQQNQAGAPHSLHMNGLHQQPSNPSQFQGQFPQQPTQVRPSHISAMMPNQQPSMVRPQVQNTGASAAQVPAYPHSKHPGYLVQHRSGMQPVQHSTAQPQGLPGPGPYVQQHPVMQAPAHLQAMGQAYQQNSTQAAIQPNVRPMISHGGLQQPYSQAPGLTNAANSLPNQPRTSQPLVNQSYPSLPVYGQELIKPSTADAQIMGKGKQESNNAEQGSGNLAGVRNAESLEPKPTVGSDANPRVFENGTPQNGNMKIKEGILDNATEFPSASNSAKENTKENEQRPDKGFSNSALPPASIAKQMHGSHSVPSSDPGRNQLGGPSPQHRFPPPGTCGGMIGGVRPDFHEGSLSKPHPPNPMEGPGFSDGRHPELRHHGSMERRPFGQTPSLHRLQDERMNMLPEEHLKPFPTDHSFGRRDFEGDLHKFPRPSHLDGGNPVKFGPPFPPPHDHGPHMFGDRLKPGGFRDVGLGRHGYPDFPRPVHGFGHHGSPGRDFRAVPTPGVGGFPHDIDGNESHSYPPGKAFQEGRFPGISGHIQRGEFDGPMNMQGSDHMIAGFRKHSRVGDPIGQDMRPMHSRRGDFGPHNVHSRDGPGAFRGHLEMGEPAFPGSYLPPRPFAEPFGREMRGYPHHGEPGFKGNYSMRYAHDDGFYRGEMEPFDNPRKRKPGSVMCRICSVDCETVEGLDLHSQTREHQKKAMDMVMSIKQQNSKKQKVSNQRTVLEEGRKNRTASFEECNECCGK
ncbi:hypothetical protein V2J09_019105, partial [Rumex salicifolius]